MKHKVKITLMLIIQGVLTATMFGLALYFLTEDQLKYIFVPIVAVVMILLSFIFVRPKK